MSKHGKKYAEALKMVDRDKTYAPEEAIGIIKKTAFTHTLVAINQA